ncbi:MAG: hypothetical protein OEZ39_15755 [Gammaproteobacteria bacterium]|nr:hypothetical protein [Gammaproteobacteria bacterium]MDH5653312.1 hypothetical protein [Gammaproteobacteria bacterium]
MPALTESYVYAFKHTSYDRENTARLNGNLWGLLYQRDHAGYQGKQLLLFGKAARVLYEGSEEATIGNAYQYTGHILH